MPAHDTDVVIIGAGVSGICTAIDIIRQNGSRNFVILEKGNQVGGTWSDNKYPGCCCDVWSHLYSFSFEQNPDWSREYSGQEEILAYLIRVAQKWQLYGHIRFNSSVEEATWLEDDKIWETKVRVTGGKETEVHDGYMIRSAFLVSAVGQLNEPRYPSIPGLETFTGKKMHSARWDQTYPLEGKRVGIIGNGATAAQIIPTIVPSVKSLVVFQRQPNWVVPRDDKPITFLKRAIYRHLPIVRRQYRSLLMDIRESFYSAAVIPDSALALMFQEMHSETLERTFPTDPEIRSKLTPSYPLGCKRVLLSDDFLSSFTQPHVTLETRPIVRVTPQGISVSSAEPKSESGSEGEIESEEQHEFDLLILATGFRTVEFLHPIRINGRHGQTLDRIWQGGARAYKGVLAGDLPNFAMLYGPNTNLGHNSIILMIEAQSRYIAALVDRVVRGRAGAAAAAAAGKVALVVRADKLREFDEETQRKLASSSFADPRCVSWYKNEAGRVTNNWSGTVVEYQKLLSSVAWGDFEVEGRGADVEDSAVTKLGRVQEETSFLGLATALQMGGALVTAVAAIGLANRYARGRRR